MKIPLETKNYIENGYKNVHDLPSSHLESFDKERLDQLEKMPREEAAKVLGEKFFEDKVMNRPGTLAAFRELALGSGAKKFAEHYSDYVCKPEKLKKNDSDMYNYMRDRIFHGREFAPRPSSMDISFTGKTEMVHEPGKKAGHELQ